MHIASLALYILTQDFSFNIFLKETNEENFGRSYKSQFRQYSANTFRRDLVTKMDIYNSTFQSLQPSK